MYINQCFATIKKTIRYDLAQILNKFKIQLNFIFKDIYIFLREKYLFSQGVKPAVNYPNMDYNMFA